MAIRDSSPFSGHKLLLDGQAEPAEKLESALSKLSAVLSWTMRSRWGRLKLYEVN
jgi:hypothetical protein